MNKRIKKKRIKLRDLRIGDRVYTHKEIASINKEFIGFLNMSYLYNKIKEPKFTRPRMKSLINYIYKNRMKHYKQNPLSYKYKYLRFARHLNEPDTITGGKAMKCGSSAVISTTQSASNSYFPLKAKRQLVGFDENGNTIWKDIKRDKEIGEQNQ